mmetsp:Transcript_7309/g.16591  ORF Transcript_7309/g.16591 Transcript_7309/m.16591 type:complete len:284 (+) Transcript_7309:1-852(+)
MISAAGTLTPGPRDESRHQTLQRSLLERERGGPREQQGSTPFRLRNTRSCDIIHSSLEDPLSRYKSLEVMRPQWQGSWHRYHGDRGYRVADQDTIVVTAYDTVQKTKKGLMRSSSGSVTYSHTHKLKAEIDVDMLVQILGDGVPGGGHMWTPRRLEWIFKERTGRPGTWVHYEVGIKAFLGLFPKTFEMMGPNHDYVQLKRNVKAPMDNVEDAIVRLAKGRESGFIQPFTSVDGIKAVDHQQPALPAINKTHRFKAIFTPSEQPRSRTGSTNLDQTGGMDGMA